MLHVCIVVIWLFSFVILICYVTSVYIYTMYYRSGNMENIVNFVQVRRYRSCIHYRQTQLAKQPQSYLQEWMLYASLVNRNKHFTRDIYNIHSWRSITDIEYVILMHLSLWDRSVRSISRVKNVVLHIKSNIFSWSCRVRDMFHKLIRKTVSYEFLWYFFTQKLLNFSLDMLYLF